MSVDFAGNGKMDVGDGSEMKNQKSPSLESGGPLQGPMGLDEGRIASSEEIVNNEGSIPSGGGLESPTDW